MAQLTLTIPDNRVPILVQVRDALNAEMGTNLTNEQMAVLFLKQKVVEQIRRLRSLQAETAISAKRAELDALSAAEQNMINQAVADAEVGW